MRIVFISDTHEKHNQLYNIEGDILIHSGDITNYGQLDELNKFNNWLSTLDFKHKIVIAGNHDMSLENFSMDYKKELFSSATYLENSFTICEGFKIYGSPITPQFGSWAFMKERGETINKVWQNIPIDIDILIAHGPPFGYLDLNNHSSHCGCEELIKVIRNINPIIHSFGHIHEAYGIKETEKTLFVNAALNKNRKELRSPIYVELQDKIIQKYGYVNEE